MGAKTYVQVIARHDEDGTTRPLRIILGNGREYHIDDVRNVQRMGTRKIRWTDPDTTRYSIRVGGKLTDLYEEHHEESLEGANTRWFVIAE